MKEFNLEEAINGKAFVLKNGYRGVIKYSVDNNIMNGGSVYGYPYIGYILTESGHLYISSTGWDLDGKNRAAEALDAVGMWEEPKISIEDLPKPFKPKDDEPYFYINGGTIEYEDDYWDSNKFDKSSAERGGCYRTREDAQKWLDFMKSMME